MDGDGTAEAVEPLLLVKDIVDLQCVGLAQGRLRETNTEDVLGFLCVAKGPAERPPHAHVSILQVLQHQLVDGDGLAIHLVAVTLVTCHRPRQHQHLRKQEHVQLRAALVT